MQTHLSWYILVVLSGLGWIVPLLILNENGKEKCANYLIYNSFWIVLFAVVKMMVRPWRMKLLHHGIMYVSIVLFYWGCYVTVYGTAYWRAIWVIVCHLAHGTNGITSLEYLIDESDRYWERINREELRVRGLHRLGIRLLPLQK